ncbi:dual CXXC motif small (seleno)protein [Desulfogranum japonicum]|uniref:dual CXXC motif small (seleno)protein n=1 Tax=Desulfogranum japonicum TaxID=231447 RepID=UPI001427D92D|nr:dual CXXC motif small (seleno)protein [Desulfogranum japonicum]
MKCKKCEGTLQVHRRCRKIRLKCDRCQHEYHIHEVAADLDAQTEAQLERFTAIIYD